MTDISTKQALQSKISIIMDEKTLKGKDRFVSDGLATKKQCKMLMETVMLFGAQGDGYYDNKSPHTEMERFEGITLSRAALLVYFSLLDAKYLELYLKLTEKAKRHLEKIFKLKQELYFAFTHLVCRSVKPGNSFTEWYALQNFLLNIMQLKSWANVRLALINEKLKF